ncbi:MAG: cupin domain-containing protein [Candidatus Dojkabacteria bacterium]|nr:MAG: cupin domain-containing protein [Candidatus Dojkabacteria bacterium]
MRNPFKKSLRNIKKEDAHGGSGSRQVLLSSGDSISRNLEAMTKGFIPAGGRYDWHVHEDVDEFFLVVKGSGVIEFAESESIEYLEGDLVYIPAGKQHRILASKQSDNEFYFVRIR